MGPRSTWLSRLLLLAMAAMLAFSLASCGGSALTTDTGDTAATAAATDLLAEDGTYTTKEDVALYLHQYGHLPENFITKQEAEALGWTGGSLEPYAPGMCIGGTYFGNYEGLLPAADGRTYSECDINTLGADSRGAERIVYSNDGLIYYTGDHYQSFTLLYGEE
jgi:guanyl-specific ribonuclease Sa